MKKILIIEDEVDVQKVLRERLRAQGFEIIGAVEGYQGINLTHKEDPDLIILDLMLPAGDGLSVLKNLRLSAHTRHIPVIVLTGMKDDEYKQKVIDEGVEAYLEKPYDVDELMKVVKENLVGETGD